MSCTYAGNVCSTRGELDLGQWKQSVLKDFLYRHSAPAASPAQPVSTARPSESRAQQPVTLAIPASLAAGLDEAGLVGEHDGLDAVA